jgi:putative membrane protein
MILQSMNHQEMCHPRTIEQRQKCENGSHWQNARMKSLLIRWVALGAAFWLAARYLTGIHVANHDFLTYAGLAFIFGLVNATLGTVTKIFTFPITILSLGLWTIAVNALMLLLTDTLSDALHIENFWWAVAGALVIGISSAIINGVLSSFIKKNK